MRSAVLPKPEEDSSDSSPASQHQEEAEELKDEEIDQQEASESPTPLYLQAGFSGANGAENPDRQTDEEEPSTSEVGERVAEKAKAKTEARIETASEKPSVTEAAVAEPEASASAPQIVVESGAGAEAGKPKTVAGGGPQVTGTTAEARDAEEPGPEKAVAEDAAAKSGEEGKAGIEKPVTSEGVALPEATTGETGAAAESVAGVETGAPEAVASGVNVQMPAVSADAETTGGGGAVPVESGSEPQGGDEDEGATELEDRLARADPERAAADEADPADVAQGEPIEAEESEARADLPELADETQTTSEEAAAGTTASIESGEQPDTSTGTSTEVETENSNESATRATTEENTTAPESEESSTIEEDPTTVEGFTGDEPALGGGALEDPETVPELSEPEKQAAMDSLGESAGGGETGASGGGGGGAAIPEKAPPEAPDVSAQEPAAALAAVGNLPPAQLKQALGGVNAAVGKSAGDKRAELAANPPSKERPTGSPKNLHGQVVSESELAGEKVNKVEQAPEGKDKPTPQPEALPEPPPSPAENVREPAVSGDEGGKLSESDVSRMSGSIASMPTRDPGLRAKAGPAPRVELSGNADPAQTDQQQAQLKSSVAETQAQGRKDVAREMGENTKIYPSVPPEELIAQVPQGGGQEPGAGAAGGPEGGVDPEALSIIARKEKGGEIQAALSQAQGDLAAKKAEYGNKVSDEKARSAEEISALEAQSAADQSQARAEAQAEVRVKKGEWSKEQAKTVREANKEADAEVARGRKDIQQKKLDADSKAAEHIKKGNEEAERERLKAEQKAAAEKRKGKKKSKGFFGWLASKAKAFFNAIKQAVKAAFDLARKLIKKAIEAARKAAMWAIEQARKAIVAAIKAVGKALIAIGDRLLAAFPRLRERFRNAIQNTVDAAVKKVNEYADKLKKGVSALLDALAAGLDKLIGWLEKGMLAVIDAYAAVVDGAIKFAEKVAQALGAFIVLIKDIAANPGQWIRNLGAGVVDGIRNHLWKAFKKAVQEWFNSKLEQVLGLGSMVWGLIKSGGLSLAKVGKMAWEGIKAMIPPTLIRILVEKLAALIVPAAGAVMLIIEGLQAAWGAVQRIIAAFQKFIAFLKAVKTGNAGPSFASALAAAAIAVIDFVANWLIAKLAKGAAKLGGKIKALAKKILGRKKGKTMGKKAKAKAPPKPKPKKPKKKPSRPPKPKKPSKSPQDRKRVKQKKKERKKRERLEKAKRELPPKIDALLAKGTKGVVLKARLLAWRVRYRLSALRISGKGKSFQIIARVNPTASLGHGVRMDRDELLKFVRDVAEEILSRKDVASEAAEIEATRGTRTTPSGSEIETVKVPKGSSIPAQVAADRRLPPLGKGKHREVTHEHSGTAVRQVQSPYAEGREHQVIREVSAEGKLVLPKKYVEIAKEAGTSGPALAAAMRTFNRTGNAPAGFDAGQLAGLQKLMFSQETLRSPAALLQAQMSLDLLAKGKSPQDIFGRVRKRGGLFPMSAKGAQPRAKAVDQALGRRPEGETPADVSKKEREQQMRREVRLIREWVKSLDIKFKPGASQRDKIEKIKREIKQRMIAAFGLD